MGHSIVNNKTTHFGFQEIPWQEKSRRIAEVFDSVTGRYDLMNDVMSFGLHRFWKRFTVELSGVRAGDVVLDLAGGTGDLSLQFARRVGATGKVILADINRSMLERGRDRLVDRGISGNVHYLQLNGEQLPFQGTPFNCISIAFGLRNFTDKMAALRASYQALKPAGRLLILEFSKPQLPGLQPFYDAYSFRVLPLLGRWIAKDEASYRYLAESIRMHPDQQSLKEMLEQAGFHRCEYFNLCGGIVALHRGYKL